MYHKETMTKTFESSTLGKDIGLVIGGSLLLALSAQVSLTLPFTPVPLTFQTLAVLFLGFALGPVRGFLACVTYLAEGAMGLPFFAKGNFGLAILTGSTAGYLLAFPLASYCVGKLKQSFSQKWWKLFVLFILGHLIILLGGWSVLSSFLGMKSALILGVIPFLSGMVIKSVVLTGLAQGMKGLRK
jgi:biotin transport system substrate-specific component